MNKEKFFETMDELRYALDREDYNDLEEISICTFHKLLYV